MNQAIVSTDFFGILTLLVILYGALFESKEKSTKKKVFVLLVATVILSLIADALGYLHIVWANNYKMQFFMMNLSHFFPFIVYSVFLYYLYLQIILKTKISKIPFIIGIGFCLLGIIFTISFGVQNKIVVIEDNNFSAGIFYRWYLLIYIVILVYAILIVLFNRKKLGRHDAIAALMFIIVPLCFIAINFFYNDLRFSIASLSISMLIISIMLNAEREQHLIENEAASAQLAHTDELTGLLNRLAFSKQCEQMQGDGKVGVIFADVNGLKFANDNKGHKSGDDLLCRFSKILLACFRKEDIYRISGDEFVVIISGITEEQFDRKLEQVDLKISQCEIPIAAWGAVFGDEKEISSLLEKAEKRMYRRKERFYEVYPKYRR